MYFFATYFDKNYLSRGLVLYDSIKKNCAEFTLYVLCIDKFTSDYFHNNSFVYPEIITIPLSKLEEYDKELLNCKNNRTLIEYYFTLSPCLPLFILENFNNPHICSLDADIMFFSSPGIVFSYLNKYSVLITPHNFSPELKSKELFGRYNVSFQIFKKDEVGLRCLRIWRKKCIEWCYDRLEDDKFADQKYLDSWTTDFEGIYAIENSGIGVAPWNINSYTIRLSGKQLFVNNDQIVFYHYHRLRIIGKNLIKHGLSDYHVKSNRLISKYIYKPYIRDLIAHNLNIQDEVRRTSDDSQTFFKTVLLQNDWFLFIGGLIFEKSRIAQILSNWILLAKRKIYG